MKIELKEIPIQEVVNYSFHLNKCQGYIDKDEDGVYGMDNRLNIRPQYQREFIYKDAQRDAVIDTITKNFPLNVLYWVVNRDGSYEVLDGQQRLISICQYISGEYSIDAKYFRNLTEDQKNQILDYKLMVYFCKGTESEKLDWFRTINIAGEKLTEQELRNAVYSGPWVSDVKKYFSKRKCPAYQMASIYLKGSAIRQSYLETVIKWINKGNVEEYMSVHQYDESAEELWKYFVDVISWVNDLFPNYRREMKGVNFGNLYNTYKDQKYDPDELESLVSKLMTDEDVKKKSGIYYYVFTHDERKLDIRAFENSQKREAYEKQSGICTHCDEHFEFEKMEADHILPWSKGGKTIAENCQMLCQQCNRIKSNK